MAFLSVCLSARTLSSHGEATVAIENPPTVAGAASLTRWSNDPSQLRETPRSCGQSRAPGPARPVTGQVADRRGACARTGTCASAALPGTAPAPRCHTVCTLNAKA